LTSPWRDSDCITAMSILPVGFALPPPMVPTTALPHAEKCLQSLLPLLEQLGSMHQHQRVHATSARSSRQR
jgi:hypothetical protein